MNGAHFHLVVNHLPIVGLLIGLVIVAAGAARKTFEWTRVGLAVVVFAGAAMIPTFYSGENAEDVVEGMQGVTHDAIEEHEEAAEPAAVAVGLTGALALAVLAVAFKRKELPSWGAPAVLVVGLVALALAGRAANLGGQIRHPELGEGFSPQPPHETYAP